MQETKQLVVLEEIEQDRNQIVGYGRTANGTQVEIPLDQAQLVRIVQLHASTGGISIWVPLDHLSKASSTADEIARPRTHGLGPRVAVILPEPLLQSLVASALEARGFDVILDTPAGVLRRFDEVVQEVLGSGVQTAALFSHGAMIRAWSASGEIASSSKTLSPCLT